MKKIGTGIFLYTFIAVILLPCAITFLYGKKEPVQAKKEIIETAPSSQEESVQVINPLTKELSDTPFEEYIIGVVGAEMPALFEEEALKAQAVAARTYAYRQLKNGQGNSTENLASSINQAYMTKEELKNKWGSNFTIYYEKIKQAVDDTKGEIMTYEKEPILAVFHSTSAGYTEKAENVWGQNLPYLQTVDSLGDEKAPDFETQVSFSQEELIRLLQTAYPDLKLSAASFMAQTQIIERTEAGYVKSIQIGNKILSGNDIRQCLSLKSSDFTLSQEGDTVTFTTKGYGHGAGMSQYGANFMAEAGYTYEEILKHYYSGVEIEKIDALTQ